MKKAIENSLAKLLVLLVLLYVIYTAISHMGQQSQALLQQAQQSVKMSDELHNNVSRWSAEAGSPNLNGTRVLEVEPDTSMKPRKERQHQ
jgi:type II secretory pathway component PulM